MNEKAKYVCISVRKEYMDEVDKLIKNNPYFLSKASVVRRALEEFLEKRQQFIKQIPEEVLKQ